MTISRASLCHLLPAALLLPGLPLQLNSFLILLTRQLPGWLSQCNAKVPLYLKTGLTGAPESALFIYIILPFFVLILNVFHICRRSQWIKVDIIRTTNEKRLFFS